MSTNKLTKAIKRAKAQYDLGKYSFAVKQAAGETPDA